MLNYLNLPVYDRRLIYDFLQHQLTYEQHVKKFAACLDQLRFPAEYVEMYDSNAIYKYSFWIDRFGILPYSWI